MVATSVHELMYRMWVRDSHNGQLAARQPRLLWSRQSIGKNSYCDSPRGRLHGKAQGQGRPAT